MDFPPPKHLSKCRILLVDDTKTNIDILIQSLRDEYKLAVALTGQKAIEYAARNQPDLILLDVMMPEMDGFTLGEKIKETQPDMPLLFLTAKSLKEDIVRGLKIGADDYITKPFDPEVLILKINNILKRAYSSANDEYKISNTLLNFNTLELTSGNTTEKLTLKEAQLLKYFIVNKNKVLAREDILTEIWGEDDYFLGRSMDVFISRLRKYISEDRNIDIRTVRGTGFILEESNKTEA